MSKVSILKCESYDISKVKNAVRESIDYLGGISSFVKPGEKVLLKVNLLMKREPEKVTTTHPSIVQAVAELVIEAGGMPIIGDNPGGHHFYNKASLDALYETCGMSEAARRSGASLNYDTTEVQVPFPQGKVINTITTIKPFIKVDKIINIPKIKTHMMTIYTGAVKNFFGMVPGSYKAQYHLKYADIRDFSDMLIDHCLFAKPVLTVMDAVIGMEGYGPSDGTPKKVGLVLASSNPFVLDVAASYIIGLKGNSVPTIRSAAKRGLCTSTVKDIEILGEPLENVYISDFKIPKRRLTINKFNLLIPRFMFRRINSSLKDKPVLNHSQCQSCKMCQENCPPKAIHMTNGYPVIDYDKCIRCFCCHELCKYKAVTIKRPLTARIFSR